MEGVTFIKGLFYFMLKANAAVGEIHHWASGDYKKDVHGWKKVKKDIQKHLEKEYSEHYKKHGNNQNIKTANYEREHKLSALNDRLEQLEKNPEKYKTQIEETKKYISNISRGKSRARDFQPKDIKQYKKDLKEKLTSMFKDYVIKQADTVFGSKINKINQKIAGIQPKIDSLKSKLADYKAEYDNADSDRKMDIDDESYEAESEMDELQEQVDDLKGDIEYLEEEKKDSIETKIQEYESNLEDDLYELSDTSDENALENYEKTKESEIRDLVGERYQNNKTHDYRTNPASIKEINITHAKKMQKQAERVKKILARLNRGKT